MNALSVRKRKNDLFKSFLLARTADYNKRSAMPPNGRKYDGDLLRAPHGGAFRPLCLHGFFVISHRWIRILR